MELPQVNQPLIESFNQQLMSTNSEKEQRHIIKGLLANSGQLANSHQPTVAAKNSQGTP